VTPQEYLAWLDAVEAKERGGAAAAAAAMAEHVADRIRNDTLTRRRHAPGQYYKAKRGDPPSYASGKFAASIYSTPAESAQGGLLASAYVGSMDKRAKLFEYGGCVLKPTSRSVMHWVDSGGSWYHAELRVDVEHPWLRPTVEETIDDGSLRRAAIDAFRPYDP
jgi:hypothetical protein